MKSTSNLCGIPDLIHCYVSRRVQLKIWILFLLIIPFASQAKFLHADITLNEYSQIIKLADEKEFYKSQKISLASRAAGIYFSMREEYLTNLLLTKKAY